MRFNNHSFLEGRHAFLSASKNAWTNYDDDKLMRMVTVAEAARRGSELHDLAHRLIRLGIKLPASRKTLNMYVNDAIGFRMTPEQVLFVSENCFGTSDAIGFRKNKLRVHDLKTGEISTSVRQLETYAAMFCIEYDFSPFKIEMEFRIYQNDSIKIYEGDPDVIFRIMDKIKRFDLIIDEMRKEQLA